MKKTIVTILGLVGLFQFAVAQDNDFKWGARIGLSTSEINVDEIDIKEGTQDFGLIVKDANYGIHIGAFAKIPLGSFFLQPEIVFNSSSVDFRVDSISGSDVGTVFKEKYQYVDIPVMLGYKFGPLRPQIGFVGHVFINSSEGLKEAFDDYQPNFDEFTFGWQGGVGLELGKVIIDLKYEGNFKKFGQHIQIGDTQYTFSESPSRLIVSLGIAF
jgi:hypothetical protein